MRDAGIPPAYAKTHLADIRHLVQTNGDTGKDLALDACAMLAELGPQQDTDEKPSLYLYGHSGTLKTTMATAVYRQWTLAGRQGIWMDFGDSLARIKAGYDAKDGSSQKVIERLQEIDILLWDDFCNDGRTKQTEHTLQIVHDVIYARHAYWRPTLLTGNYTPKQLELMLGQPIWRRIRQWATIVPCDGKVYGDE